jgi:threonyl-tRNA synthetase
MSQIRVRVLDRQSQGTEREVTTGTTASDLYAGDPIVVVARVNGQLRDLSSELHDGDVVEPVPADSKDGLMVIRHSAAHVMAQAVQQAFPAAKLGIGPPIENGFYYDFDVPQPFTPDDLKAIEARMRVIVKQGQRFARREVSDEQARLELAAEPYKLELVGIKGQAGDDAAVSTEVGAGVLSIYDNVDPKTCAGKTCAGARTCPAPGTYPRSS